MLICGYTSCYLTGASVNRCGVGGYVRGIIYVGSNMGLVTGGGICDHLPTGVYL